MALGHGPYRLCMMMVGVCGSGVCGHWCCCCGRGGRCIVFLFWKIIVRWCLLLAVNGRGCMTANMPFFSLRMFSMHFLWVYSDSGMLNAAGMDVFSG